MRLKTDEALTVPPMQNSMFPSRTNILIPLQTPLAVPSHVLHNCMFYFVSVVISYLSRKKKRETSFNLTTSSCVRPGSHAASPA